MLEIDGSMGEGGGQIVRSALSLSILTQQPIRLAHIRAGRDRPGLRPQHVTAVEASAEISRATVEGATRGSSTLVFAPSGVYPGTYRFEVGTAGSAILVLQTLLPPLLTAPRSSTVTVEGGTHNRSAPPFEFFARSFLPLIERMGPVLRAQLHRPGFYPKGGGECTVEVTPVESLDALSLMERGPLRRRRAQAIVANLPRHIGERELDTLRKEIPGELDEGSSETPPGPGAGNALIFELEFAHLTTVVSGIGRKGLPAEKVAASVADTARSYLTADAPVDPCLADQLLIPLALGGGRFRTTALTAHTHTNAAVIERFMGDVLDLRSCDRGWVVEAEPSSD